MGRSPHSSSGRDLSVVESRPAPSAGAIAGLALSGWHEWRKNDKNAI
jgi:hypothetical protein